MGIEVLTRASNSNLIELASVKTRLGIEGTSEDETLTELIEEASSSIVDYIGRPLARQRYRETIAGEDRPRIVLSRYPVDTDSVTVTVDGIEETDHVIENPANGVLYLSGGWPRTFPTNYVDYRYGGEKDITVTYTAGYLLPGDVASWTASTAVALHTWIRPSTASLSPYLYQVTTAGITGASEPSYPASTGLTVASGTAVLTARDAVELPAVIRKYAFLLVRDAYSNRPTGLTSQSADGFSESYDASRDSDLLPQSVKRGLDRWRLGH